MSFEKKGLHFSHSHNLYCLLHLFPSSKYSHTRSIKEQQQKNTKFILMCVFLFSFDQIKIIINIMSFFHFLLLSSIFLFYQHTLTHYHQHHPTDNSRMDKLFFFCIFIDLYILIYIAIITIIIIKNLA